MMRNTVRYCFAAVLVLFLVPVLPAHTVISTNITWTREISRIVYKRCVSCHRDGGASFSLTTYADARPWAEAIKEEVLARQMPPWNAVKGFGQFKDDRGLTQEDIDIIAAWVVGGAPEGDPAYLPSVPNFTAQTGEDNLGARRIAVAGSMVMGHSVDVIGIEPTRIPEGGVLQAIAVRPDGSIEPLIWIQKFNPNYSGVYYFTKTLRLPARTRIEITPAIGSLVLILQGPSGHTATEKTGSGATTSVQKPGR
jgi:hypothetical protein